MKIKALFKNWIYEIKKNPNQFDKLNRKLFEKEYTELAYAAELENSKLTNFESVYEAAKESLQRIIINELNRENNKVDFKKKKFNLIIGGDLLDRGFVVKGLDSAKKISANTDTLQQRGRMHKRSPIHDENFSFKSIKKMRLFHAKTEADLYSKLKAHFEEMEIMQKQCYWYRPNT